MVAECKACTSKSLENKYHGAGCEENLLEHIHRHCKSCGNDYTVVPADIKADH